MTTNTEFINTIKLLLYKENPSLLEKVDFEVIFVTAHEEFSIQALRERAFDYVLKPLFSDEFNQVIQRFLDKKASEQKNQLPTKLFFPNTNGIEVIEIDNISYCKADNVYTSIIKNDGVEILVSKPFKTILEMLAKDNFMRIHRSFLANMSQVARYSNEDGGLLHFKNGHKIPISNSYKKEILRFLS